MSRIIAMSAAVGPHTSPATGEKIAVEIRPGVSQTNDLDFSVGDDPRIDTILARAARSLIGHSDSPRLDAQLLLAQVLGVGRTALIADGDRALDAAVFGAFELAIARRRSGVPVAYLTGRREFWSLELEVTPAVLVPRPETELLVELALARLPEDRASSVLDLGTGSGAIALAIAHERPRAAVTAVDLSPEALAVATANARTLGIQRIEWCQGSWFSAVPGRRFDVIVSNPPYVAADDPALAALGAEPRLALTPGPTGLEALAAIAAGAARHLELGGWLILEHGAGQAAEVATLLTQAGFTAVASHRDPAGAARAAVATLHATT
jgi:release factor glutamine methyltransferase